MTTTADTLWINGSVGVAGDMLLAALIDAGADRLAVLDAWGALGLDGFAASFERVDRCGVAALWANIVVGDVDHAHHRHPTERRHVHRPAAQVISLIDRAALPDRVRADAVAVYRCLAAVEADIHQQDPTEVELHEVGALDSILDVVGVCAALNDLNVDHLWYAPIGVGAGTVSSAHGRLPHPAPATVRLLAEARAAVVGVDTDMETATPTGVALLSVLGVPSPTPPPMQLHAVGYGAGTADPADRANIVQALYGSRTTADADDATEPLVLIETNVDDTTGEIVAYTIQRLMEHGALDGWATPIVMKKGRLAATVSCLCKADDQTRLRTVLCEETGSLGARLRSVDRWAAKRTVDQVVVDGHPIGIKRIAGRTKVEYADAAAAAQALRRPLRLVIADAERLAAARGESLNADGGRAANR